MVRWGGVLVLTAVLATGCFGPPPEAVARLEETKRAGDELALHVDALEERMLANQANLHLWDELARRSRTVTEIACENHTEHFNAMVEAMDKQQQKARQLRRRRVATVDGDTPGTTVAASSSRRGGKARN